MKLKTDCYKCKSRGNLPINSHLRCSNPDPKMTGDPHGIRMGWFMYPWNFDPIWRTKECDNFAGKDGPS